VCGRVRAGSWDGGGLAGSGHEIGMAAGSGEIAESLSDCVRDLATAAEALQSLGGGAGSQMSESGLTMVKRPTEPRIIMPFKSSYYLYAIQA